MALDSETQMLYVFGGRIVDGEWDTVKCAGMYCYNVRRSKWSCIMYDFSFAPSQIILNLSGRHCHPGALSKDLSHLVSVRRESSYHHDV